jgi:hypothetical protein
MPRSQAVRHTRRPSRFRSRCAASVATLRSLPGALDNSDRLRLLGGVKSSLSRIADAAASRSGLVGMAGRHQPAEYRSFEAGEPIHDFEMRGRSWKLHGGEQTTEGRETPSRVLLPFRRSTRYSLPLCTPVRLPAWLHGR